MIEDVRVTPLKVGEHLDVAAVFVGGLCRALELL